MIFVFLNKWFYIIETNFLRERFSFTFNLKFLWIISNFHSDFKLLNQRLIRDQRQTFILQCEQEVLLFSETLKKGNEMYFLKITRDRTVLPRSGSLLMVSTKCKLIGFSKSWTTSASSILNFENEHLKKSNVPLQQSHYPSYLFYMDLFNYFHLDFHCFKVLEPLLSSWKII